MANFCCSIEMEPRTLNQGQLHLAREVAVDIVQKTVQQEASTACVEALKPVAETMETVLVIQETNGVEVKKKHDDSANDVVFEKVAQQCLCTANILESPDDESNVKQPLTAPF